MGLQKKKTLLSTCLCFPQCLNAGTVQLEEMAIASQLLGNHVMAATNTHTTEQLLAPLFFIQSMSTTQ
jgi:hypothetical protein